MGLDPKLQEYVDEIIRHKARQLARKAGFSQSDREDIEHELLIAVLERWHSFDANRASARTFVARIIENKAASLVRACQAAKRGVGQCTPLARDMDGSACDFDEERVRSRRGLKTRSIIEALCLRMDLAEIMADLPPDLRSLCKQLMRGSVSAVARDSGTRRTTLYRAIRQLRRRLEDAELDEYL